MIVILDTNTLHMDVYAEKQWAAALFRAAAERDDLEVWVPSVVVEEMVRQFPEKVQKVEAAARKFRNLAFALGWEMPLPPDMDSAAANYRSRLEANLSVPGVRIVREPKRAGLIAEWVACRRGPIPGDGKGTVDAQIWLTAAEAAEKGEVALVTSNWTDFCDPEARSQPHETLRDDLDSWGIPPGRIEVFRRILEFNERHVTPSIEATEESQRLLGDVDRRARLISEVESAVAWFPLDAEKFDLGADWIEEATLAAFDVGALRLVRADPGARGLSLTIELFGSATLDLGLAKADAHGLDEDSPIAVDDWDWNEWNVSAHAEVSGSLLVEVLHADEEFMVSVDALEPLTEDAVQALLETWTEANPETAFTIVAAEFDVSGQQEARAVSPKAVEKFYFKEEAVFLRAEFTVDYANPVDEEDHQLSAENVTEHVIDLRIEHPDFDNGECGEVTSVDEAFPD